MPDVFFKDQVLRPGEPLVLKAQRTARVQDQWLGLWELDSYYDERRPEGRRRVFEGGQGPDANTIAGSDWHEKGPPPRLLGRFKVSAGGGAFTAVGENELDPAPVRGQFDGLWEDMRLEHFEGSQEVKGEAAIQGLKGLRGQVVEREVEDPAGATPTEGVEAGPPPRVLRTCLDLRWKGDDGATGRMELVFLEKGAALGVEHDTLTGLWWFDGQRREDVVDRLEHQVYLTRSATYDAREFPGFRVPLAFAGRGEVKGGLLVPLEEVVQEFGAAGRTDKTSLAPTSVMLEIGMSLTAERPEPGRTKVSPEYWAEVPVPFDHETHRDFVLLCTRLNGYLWAADLVRSDDPWLSRRREQLWSMLEPGVPYRAPGKGQDYVDAWEAGVEDARADGAALHEGIVFRFALLGATPGQGENGFPKTDKAHFELDWFHRNAGDPRYAATLARGKQMHRLLMAASENEAERAKQVRAWLESADSQLSAVIEGVVHAEAFRGMGDSPFGEITPALLEESLAAGVSENDAREAYRLGAGLMRQEMLGQKVKTYAWLGFDADSEDPRKDERNPFAGATASGASQMRRRWERNRLRDMAEFRSFQELIRPRATFDEQAQRVVVTRGRFHAELEQGRAMRRLMLHGLAVGRGEEPESREQQRKLTQQAVIPEEDALRIYEMGLRRGEHERRLANTNRYFLGNQKRFGDAVLEYATRVREDAARWSHGTVDRHRVVAQFELDPAGRSLLARAREEGVPDEIFRAVVARSINETLDHLHDAESWSTFFYTFFRTPVEWLGAAAWAVKDVVWECSEGVGGVREAADFIDLCKRDNKYSPFHRFAGNMTRFEVFGLACVGLADAYLKIRALSLLNALFRGLRTCVAVGSVVGFRAFAAAVAVGGAQWLRGNFLRTISSAAVFGAGMGATQELAHSIIDGREYHFSNASRNALHHSLTFLFFTRTHAMFSALARGRLFMALAGLHMVSGTLDAGLRVIEANRGLDAVQKKRAWRDLVDQMMMFALLLGPGALRMFGHRACRAKADPAGVRPGEAAPPGSKPGEPPAAQPEAPAAQSEAPTAPRPAEAPAAPRPAEAPPAPAGEAPAAAARPAEAAPAAPRPGEEVAARPAEAPGGAGGAVERLEAKLQEAAEVEPIRPLASVEDAVARGVTDIPRLKEHGIRDWAELRRLQVTGAADLVKLGLDSVAKLKEFFRSAQELAEAGVRGVEDVRAIIGEGQAKFLELVDAGLMRDAADLHRLGIRNSRMMEQLGWLETVNDKALMGRLTEAEKFEPRIPPDYIVEGLWEGFTEFVVTIGKYLVHERRIKGRPEYPGEKWSILESEVELRDPDTGQMVGFFKRNLYREGSPLRGGLREVQNLLEFDMAFAGRHVDSWCKMPSDTVEYVPGKGWPIELRLTFQMTRLLLEAGELPSEPLWFVDGFRALSVVNLHTATHVKRVAGPRNYSPEALEEALGTAQSHNYMFNTMRQMGFVVRELVKAPQEVETQTIREVINHFELHRDYWMKEIGGEPRIHKHFRENPDVFPKHAKDPEACMEVDVPVGYDFVFRVEAP